VARKKAKSRDRNRNPGWSVALIGKKPKRRMSDTIVEFARPELLREEGSAREWQFELQIAALVWNGVLAGESAQSLVKKLCEDREPGPDFVALIETLVRRKQVTFAHDKRFVMGIEAYDTSDGVHVMAASAM
jgi:hypothetical protein